MVSVFLHLCCTYVAHGHKGPEGHPDRLSARVRAEVGVALGHFDGDVSHQLLNDLERDASRPACTLAARPSLPQAPREGGRCCSDEDR